jgi:aminopeptidase N
MHRHLIALTFALGVPLAAGAQGPTPYRRGIDVLDYAFSIELPDTGTLIRGDAMVTFRRTARVDTLVLDLRQLRVQRVTLEDRTRRFTRNDSTIRVPLPRGDTGTFRVRVVYSGQVTDGLIARKDSAGRWTYFGDNWPNRARFWLPTVDHPSDKATVTWSVRAPVNRTVVANGSQIQRVTTGRGRLARATTRWRESKPIATYLMVIAAAPLVRHDLGETACGVAEIRRCVPQQVYVAPEQRRVLPGNFSQAGEIVRYFGTLVGPYPYEKLAHLQSTTRFGGMENASAIFYSDREFRGSGVSVGLIAHETAHQWFGNSVTQRDWPHLWLSEGFATYFAALWTQRSQGDSAFRLRMDAIRASILADTNAVARRSVIDTAPGEVIALLNRNSYEKGGFVLHMLRSQLGDSVFFRGVRDYYTRFKHANALSSDLQAALERASGQRLGGFFDQWLRRSGYAELEVVWRTDSLARSLSLSVNQSGRFGVYEFPALRLALADAAGTIRRVEIGIPAQDTTKVELPISGPVRSIEVDPEVQVLARITVRKQP